MSWFTRYHAALRVGRVLAAHCQRQELVDIHLRQSHLDSACAHHCLAMALITLGLVKRSAVLDMSRRRYGRAASLYSVLADYWMEGVFAAEVVAAIDKMDLPITVDWIDGFDKGVDRFAVDALMAGSLVMLAHEAERPRYRHWTLGIGCGGTVENNVHHVTSVLTIDPSLDGRQFAIGNGQFSTTRAVDFKKRRTSVRWVYETVEGAETVRLMSAISIRLRPSPPSKRRH